jgi:catechol 2,3-dioxygenase-like lactoylglutathione lyase family enzyme
MKAKIARVIMYVKDFEGLARWYCETFGFKLRLSRPDARWVEVDIGRGVVLAFHGGGHPKAYKRPPQMMLEVPDVEQAKAKREAKGLRLGKIGRWEHVVWCHGKDPEGNPFQLTEPVRRAGGVKS